MPETHPFPLKLDFDLLRRQKTHLLSITSFDLTQDQSDALEGMLNFIDYLQDYAVDNLGYAPEDIYYLSKGEE